MKDIKTKEVTTKPKTKNPASRIPKELMRTAILESKEKSQTIANARDNDMGEQSPSEYASGKVTSAEEWAARKTGRTVTRAGKTAAQTSYEKIKQRAVGKKEVEKEAEKETARGTGDTQTADPASRETPEQKSREVQIQKAQRQKAVSDAVKTKEQKIRAARETPRIQNGQEIVGRWSSSPSERQSQKKQGRRYRKADCHPPETAGNHSDQGKTKETAGAENHTEAYHQDGSSSLRRSASSQSRSSVRPVPTP